VLLLCSVTSAVPVPSENSLGAAVCCEGCITEYKQAVPHSVCAERFLELYQLVNIFIVFCQISFLFNVDVLNMY
jgi:hypothetical protein